MIGESFRRRLFFAANEQKIIALPVLFMFIKITLLHEPYQGTK